MTFILECWSCHHHFPIRDPHHQPLEQMICPVCNVELQLPEVRPPEPTGYVFCTQQQKNCGFWAQNEREAAAPDGTRGHPSDPEPPEAVVSDETAPTPGVAFYAFGPEIWTAQDIVLLHRLLADEKDRLTEQQWQIRRLQQQVSRLVEVEEEEEEE